MPPINHQTVIDRKGFRLNVGIVLLGPEKTVLLAKRLGEDAWQFPQGGIAPRESDEEAMYRELYEEIGLSAGDVQICGKTDKWLYYRLPKQFIRYHQKPLCIGQRQKWFLLKLNTPEEKIRLNLDGSAEFDSWRWVDYWQPVKEIIYFKRRIYQQVLSYFQPDVFPTPIQDEGSSLC